MALSKKAALAIDTITASIRDVMKTLPEHPAEGSDYRAWAERFIQLIVRVTDLV